MDDDDIFERSMTSLGVEPLDGSAKGPAGSGHDPAESSRPPADSTRPPAKTREEGVEEDDLRLFEQAMRELDGGEGEAGDSRQRRAELPKPRRLKTRPKHLRVDEHLDLHGLKADEALRRLGHFVVRASSSGVRTVLVITGKGHHSPGGRGVLRQRVEEWIGRRGRRLVRAWSEAPARLGGRGAFVLYLRNSSG